MPLSDCRFTNAAGGTVDWTFPGPAGGLQSPVIAGAVDGTTYRYVAQSFDGSQWEIGTGAYTSSSGVFARTTIESNSLGDTTKINFTTPPHIVILSVPPSAAEFFEAGTVSLFWQTAAPTGWTKLTTQNDKALRVVSGSGGVAGGTNAFSTVMAQTVVGSSTLSTAQLAAHTHTQNPVASSGTATYYALNSVFGDSVQTWPATGSAGSGSSHNHTITMAIQYIDIILASKD